MPADASRPTPVRPGDAAATSGGTAQVPDTGTDKQSGNQQNPRGPRGLDHYLYSSGTSTPTEGFTGMEDRDKRPVSPAVLKFIEQAGPSSGSGGVSTPGGGISGGGKPSGGSADHSGSRYIGAASDSGMGSGAGSPDPPDAPAAPTGPDPAVDSGTPPAQVPGASLIFAPAIPAPDAGTEGAAVADATVPTTNGPTETPTPDAGSAGDGEQPEEQPQPIAEVIVEGHPELAKVEQIVAAEHAPADKLAAQSRPNGDAHVANVVTVINAYLAAAAKEGGSLAEHLLRAGSTLTQDRSFDAKHSESLILRDAQRFFYGAVGPYVFSNPDKLGGLDPVSASGGRAAASADPLLGARDRPTVAGWVVSSLAPGVYEVVKGTAIALGLEEKIRANDELPTSGIGGLSWHSYGEKYASPNNGHDLEAKGNAPGATVDGYRASETIDQELEWAKGEAIGTMDR